jgi:hypothetical protein
MTIQDLIVGSGSHSRPAAERHATSTSRGSSSAARTTPPRDAVGPGGARGDTTTLTPAAWLQSIPRGPAGACALIQRPPKLLLHPRTPRPDRPGAVSRRFLDSRLNAGFTRVARLSGEWPRR